MNDVESLLASHPPEKTGDVNNAITVLMEIRFFIFFSLNVGNLDLIKQMVKRLLRNRRFIKV
jgi:hypothetical protein